MTAPKSPPTPQAIIPLLKKAGHTKAVVKMRGGNSGYEVSIARSRNDAVRVRHRFWTMGATAEMHAEKLAAYAEVIRAAGWTVEVGQWELVVTAPKTTEGE